MCGSATAKATSVFSLNVRLKAVDVTDLGSKGAYRIGGLSQKKICKIQSKSLLLASFPGKKVRWVGSGKRLSEGGKWGSVERA